MKKHEEKLSEILPKIGEDAIIVGFNPVLAAQNVSAFRRLLNGEPKSALLAEMKIGQRQFSRIKKRLSQLQEFRLQLADGITSVNLPPVWAKDINQATNFLGSRFCGGLELPGWRFEGCGNPIPLHKR